MVFFFYFSFPNLSARERGFQRRVGSIFHLHNACFSIGCAAYGIVVMA